MADQPSLSIAPILRDAVRRAPRDVRRSAAIALVGWVVVMAGQIYDSAGRGGPAATAEFLSALCGSAGGVLLGLASMLLASAQRAEGSGHSRAEADRFRRVLMALPALALSSAVLLSAAVTLMIVRAILGTSLPFVIVIGAVLSGLLWLAGATVMNATRTLYAQTLAEAATAAAARAEAGEAQMAALQARMNPHFLFNALNTVAGLVRLDPARAERAIENLAGVLRMTLERSAERMGTVGDEVELVRAYVALEQERFGDRLRVQWDIDPQVSAAPLPPLLLQPIVENALSHGIGSRIDGGVLRIAATRGPGSIVVLIEDDGTGFPASQKERTGLGNVRARLASLYGSAASLEIDRTAPGGRVRVTIPWNQ